MRQRNQWSKGQVRTAKLPIVSVTSDERVKVERAMDHTRLAFAQLIRAGLVAIGVLDKDSMYDLPEEYAERVMRARVSITGGK